MPQEEVKTAVLLVSVASLFGGAETYYVKLARLLGERHKLVAVVCNKKLAREFELLGVEVLYAGDDLRGVDRYLQTWKACRRMMRTQKLKLAHLNGQPESYLAVFLRLCGLRLLSTRHTPFTDLYLKEGSRLPIALKRWMVLFSLRRVGKTICVSKLLQRQLSAYLPERSLEYIPTWVEPLFLENYERPMPSSPLRALFVGRVVTNKGIMDVIEAVRRCKGVQLTVIGEGDQMEEAQRRADGLPIVFSGFMLDCRPAYAAADLLIFGSPEGFEGLPQVPLEAMAMGLPCLASDISSIRELAGTEGSEALAMYRQGDVDDLARQLERLARDPEELRRLSAAGRVNVERHFTAAVVREPYLRAFAVKPTDMRNAA